MGFTLRKPADDPIVWIVGRILPPMVAFCLIVLAVLIGTHGLTNDDTFFHLRIGSEFRRGTWSIRHPGSMSTFATRDWVPTQWLAEMAMSKAETLGGTRAVAWLGGTLIVAYALTLYVGARRVSPANIAVLVALVAFVASVPGMSPRPQVMSYLLAAVLTSAWLATARDGRVRWWIIPMTWLWATLHGMWPISVVISVAGAVGVILDRRPDRRESARLLAVPAVSLIAGSLTPIGPRLIIEVFTVTSRAKYFPEWGPTDFHAAPGAALVILLGFGILLLTRTRPSQWCVTLLLLLSAAWAVYSARTAPISAAMAAPCVALLLSQLMPDSAPFGKRARATIMGTGMAASVAVAVLSASQQVGPRGIAAADAALDDLPPHTAILNEGGWGGYLSWRHPDLNFVISGYGDMYTTQELDRNEALMTTEAGWLDDLETLPVDWAVLAPDSRLAYGLQHSAGWKTVKASDTMVMLHAAN